MTKGMIAQLETENALYPVEGENMLMPILP